MAAIQWDGPVTLWNVHSSITTGLLELAITVVLLILLPWLPSLSNLHSKMAMGVVWYPEGKSHTRTIV